MVRKRYLAGRLQQLVLTSALDLGYRRAFFENFGTVLEAFVSYDRHTGRPRGFGFVVFEDPAVADKVVSLQHTIDRREVSGNPTTARRRVLLLADVQGCVLRRRSSSLSGGGRYVVGECLG